MEQLATDMRVAITGLGVLCALGSRPEQVFQRMLAQETGIRGVARFPVEAMQCKVAGELDADGLAEAAAAGAEYAARLHGRVPDQCASYAIAAARQALESSGLRIIPAGQAALDEVQAARSGIALGTCNGGIVSLERQWRLEELEHAYTASYPFYQQGDDAAQALGLEGPVATINTACAASGNAIGYAYDMIRWGYADVMLAGGSDPLSHTVYAGFHVLRALNPQPASPFSNRYGLNLGEGAAILVLERMDRALARGATLYGELCGYGLSNDGYHETAPHPEGAGIKRAVAGALRHAGLEPGSISYINAHGTGTQANDQAELSGLRGVFGSHLGVPISSSKAYFGHNLGAAAAVELATALYAIQQGYLPATLHFDTPREGCEEADIIGGAMRERPAHLEQPAYMLSNNSAFGGHNVSLAIRTDAGLSPSSNSGSPASERKRVAITGIGAAGSWGIGAGSVLQLFARMNGPQAGSLQEPFSLKRYAADKYERRMSKLAQFSIGAALAAVEDAALSGEKLEEAGFIYGTARGSTDSIAKFLGSVFEKGPEYASSIYFPQTVINSIAGKTSEKMGLRGFNSSLSTGGSEGLTAALYGSGKIREGVLNYCLIGSGDERSALTDAIDAALGLDASCYQPAEGSACLMLAEMERASAEGSKLYAELLGFGHGRQLVGAVEQAMIQAVIASGQVEAVLLNSVGRPGELEREQQLIEGLLTREAAADIPILSLNGASGYGESLSAMLHLAAAAELVAGGNPGRLWPGMPRRAQYGHVVVVSSSVNGNYVAAVVGAVDECQQ